VLALRPTLSGWPSPPTWLLAALVIHLSFLLRFLLQSVITMACFWSERAAALERLLLIPYLFLSGLVAPLEAFPSGVRRLAEATPFPSMVAFPARLLSGAEVDLVAGLATMAAWGALLLPLYLLLWRAGHRRYAAMGA
jgi:ABC-2 type transport system permease protein